MMTDPGYAPPLRCGRLLTWPLVDTQCPRDATTHVIWNVQGANTLACDEHANVIRTAGRAFAMHPYEMVCSMPWAQYRFAENRCEEGELGIEEPTLAAVAQESDATEGGES